MNLPQPEAAGVRANHRTMRDPYTGKDVEISEDLCDRLRGRYACGPTMENGEPEFGWREFETPPVQHEAAAVIATLRAEIERVRGERDALRSSQGDRAGEMRLPKHRLLTLRWMHERSDRMMRTANRCGDRGSYALYREEVDALDAVFAALPLTTEDAR